MLFYNKLVVFSSLNAVHYVLRALPEMSYTQSCAGAFGDGSGPGSGCGGGRVAVHHQMRPYHTSHQQRREFHTVRIWRPASWFDRTPTAQQLGTSSEGGRTMTDAPRGGVRELPASRATRTNLLAILGYTVTRTDDDDDPRVHVEYLSVCNDQEIIEPTEAVELRQSLVAHLSQTDVGIITMLM